MTKTTSQQKQTKSKAASKPKPNSGSPNSDQQTALRDSPYLDKNSSITINIPWEEVEPVYQRELKQQAKELKLKGFRKGKVPPQMAEKKLGKRSLVQGSLDTLLPERYRHQLEQEGKQPITSPEFQAINVNKDNDWELKAVFAEKPDIELGDYRPIVEKAKRKAQEELQEVKQQRQKKREELAKKAKEAKEAQEAQEGDDSQRDDDTQADQAKQAQKAAQAQKVAKLTEKQEKDIIIQNIFNLLITELAPKIPSMLVEEYIKKELGQLMQRLSKLEIQLQDYLQGQGLTKQQLVENIGRSVLSQLQVEFLLREIQKQEKITISDDELQGKLDELEEKGLEEVDRDNEQQLQFIRAHLRKQKTLDFLLEV